MLVIRTGGVYMTLVAVSFSAFLIRVMVWPPGPVSVIEIPPRSGTVSEIGTDSTALT